MASKESKPRTFSMSHGMKNGIDLMIRIWAAHSITNLAQRKQSLRDLLSGKSEVTSKKGEAVVTSKKSTTV